MIDGAGRTTKIECDALAVSGGWNPAVHLTCHLGGKPVWNEAARGLRARRGARRACMSRARRTAALTLAECLTGGIAAGAMAAVECGFQIASIALPSAEDEPAAITPLWHVKESRAKAFVDFQNDVTTKDIALADQEGFSSVEHLKRYTTLGMATDQGKVANVIRARDPRRSVRPHDSAGRHHDLSAALCAGELRRDDRASSRQGFPPDPAAAVASMGGGAGRGVRRDRRSGCARSIIRAPARRTGSKPSTAR